MRWELRHRDESAKQYSAAVAKFLADRGADPIEGITEPEPVYPHLRPIWQAWQDLNMSRQSGMAAVGLPWAELSCYCADRGIDGERRLRWIRLLRAMDVAYLIAQGDRSERRQREREAKRNGKSRSRD